MSHDQSHEPTFGPRESVLGHPMPGPTEEMIAKETRLEHELAGVRKHLADIRAKCHHHFVPSLKATGFTQSLVPDVCDLGMGRLATFTCTKCGEDEQFSVSETGRCPCCGTKLGYKWIPDSEQKKYFGNQEFDGFYAPALISCPSCDFKGAQMLYDR